MKYEKKHIVKDYKSKVIKYLALFIGVCYLANPLQSQISVVFHEISHVFDAPDMPIGHTAVGDKENVTHHYHEHTHSNERHEHTLIDILDSIFNASDDGGQEESVLVDIKVDKHTITDKYPFKKISFEEKNIIIASNINNTIKGFSNILEEPPQSF